MRLTLEELRAMSNQELERHWMAGLFPFDNIPSCYACLTIHWQGVCKKHHELTAATRQSLTMVEGRTNTEAALRANLEQLYALRLFYDHFYEPAEPAPAAAEQQVAEAVAVRA